MGSPTGQSFSGLHYQPQEAEESAGSQLSFSTSPQERKQYFAAGHFPAFVIQNSLALLCKGTPLKGALCAPLVEQSLYLLGRLSQKKRHSTKKNLSLQKCIILTRPQDAADTQRKPTKSVITCRTFDRCFLLLPLPPCSLHFPEL